MPPIAIITNNAEPPAQATSRRFEISYRYKQQVTNEYHNFGAGARFPR